MEAFLSTFGASVWGPIALSFLFGVAFGWLIWGAKPDRRKPEDGPLQEDDPKELVVLRAEIEAARALLDEPGDMDGAVAERLAAIDESFKRAESRLAAALDVAKRVAL